MVKLMVVIVFLVLSAVLVTMVVVTPRLAKAKKLLNIKKTK